MCSQSNQPDESKCDIDERDGGFCEFVLARGDTAEFVDALTNRLNVLFEPTVLYVSGGRR